MPKKYTEAPYYERDNIVKNYYKLLAIPGRYAQSAEFTEIQSILLDCIKSIGDSLFKEGNVQSGCELIVKGNKVTITSGKIYLDGIVRNTVDTTVTITGEGTEHITVRVVESIVSESEDTSLLDPATGSSSAMQPGCFRVKQEVVFEVNGEGATIATLLNGIPQNYIINKPQMDVINEVLARRTFAESGNYIVSGCNLKNLKKEENGNLLVGLGKGMAFIKGYEINNPTDLTFEVPKAITTREVTAEPKTYTTSSKSFKLNNSPVQTISRVLVTLQTTDTFNFNSLISEYDLSHDSVSSIVEVKSGDTTYTSGTDYALSNDKIVWKGTKPSNGSNFTVKFNYKSTLTVETDYKVSNSTSSCTITISNSALVNNSEVLIDYNYYLARRDLVCLNSEGAPVVISGEPDDLEDCLVPKIDDLSVLAIGNILIYPNQVKYDIVNDTVRVSTMQNIQNAIERLTILEENVIMTALEQELYSQESSEQLRGMFTESFSNYDKLDTEFDGVSLAFDDLEGKMYPMFEETTHTLSLSTSSSNRYAKKGDVYMLPYTSKIVIQQNDVTGDMLVNPYQAFEPMMAVDVTPSVDTWVNTTQLADSVTTKVKYTYYAWWGGYARHKTTETRTLQRQEITDKASTYMRQRTVTVKSETFPPSANNVTCYFNGQRVTLTPINTTKRGINSYSVQPDDDGLLEATFTVPNKVPCGTVEVKLQDLNFVARGQYRSTGTERSVRNIILVTRNVASYIDPLAESFVFDNTRVLTGLDLYFTAKDNYNALVQIRNVEAGFPGKIIYSEVTIPSSKINVSSKGTTATHVDFPNVVQCEKDTEYCFVVLTDSSKLRLATARLGEKTLDNTKFIVSNPYPTGVMFSSSNASSWTAHQDMDLKFRLYAAEFQTSGALYFNRFTTNSVDRLLYTIDIMNDVSAKATPYASINGASYKIIEPWQDYELTSVAKSCQVCIMMSTKNKYSTPFINADSAQVISFKSDNEAVYVSKNIVLDSACSDIKVMMNVSSKSQCSYKVYFATDGTGTTWVELTSPTAKVVDSDTKKLTYTKTGQSIENFRIKIVATTTNTCVKPFVSKLGVILNEGI